MRFAALWAGVALASLAVSPVPSPRPASTDDAVADARALFERGDLAGAASAYERALAAQPRSLAAMYGLASAYAALGDQRAEETFRRALATDPNDGPARLGLAELYWAEGRIEDGNAQMEKLLVRGPSNTRLRARYAEVLIGQRRFVQAAAELERLCRAGACDAGRMQQWAEALLETGRFDASAEAWRKAIAAQPAQAESYYGLGRLLLLKGDAPGAAEALSRAASLEPGSAAIRVEYGRALEALGRYGPAEEQYRQALSLDPQMPRAHYALGTLLARMSRGEEARAEIALYQAAFDAEQKRRQRESSRRARVVLAWTELSAGRAETALQIFVDLPEDPETLRGRAAALSALSRHAEAVRALEAALALTPGDARLAWALSRERERSRP